MKKACVLVGILVAILPLSIATGQELTTYEYDCNCSCKDIYVLKDGTIFRKIGFGFVGFMSLGDEVIFLKDGIVCMNGGRFKYRLLELGEEYHYSKRTYRGIEAYEKFHEICGE